MDSITLVKNEWHYELDGQKNGPITEDEIINLITDNILSKSNLVWKKGMVEWSQLEKTALSSHLSHVPPPLPTIITTQPQKTVSINRIEELDAIRKECLSLATKRSVVSAGVSAVPFIPLIDVVTDIVIIYNAIPEINRKFGLAHDQINQYDEKTKAIITKQILIAGGSKLAMIGIKMTYRVLLARMTKYAGRYIVREVANFIPVVDIALGATIGFTTMKLILNSHVNMCHKVAVTIAQTDSNAVIDVVA